MSKNGEIYTAGKNFTLLPALTGWTNSTSGSLVRFETNICSLVGFETNIFVGRTLDKYIGWSDMRQIMVANQIYKLQTGDKHLPLLLQSLNKQNASNVSDDQSKPFYTSITSSRVKV